MCDDCAGSRRTPAVSEAVLKERRTAGDVVGTAGFDRTSVLLGGVQRLTRRHSTGAVSVRRSS